MKVLALTRYSRMGASSRLRTYQYVDQMERSGINVTLEPLLGDDYLSYLYKKTKPKPSLIFKSYWNRVKSLFLANEYDLLWIEKEIFPNLPYWFERICLFRNIPYVVDFDDAIFHNYDLASNPLKRLMRSKIDKIMAGASIVVCGNQYLADRAGKAGAKSVAILPTVVDLERYHTRNAIVNPCPVIGWIGSPSTIKYLLSIIPLLTIINSYLEFKLLIIGAEITSERMGGLNVECRPWSESTEVDDIRSMDIGIMPLHDTPWERGKCGYKLIQYMACGLPVVASAVGANVEIVKHGENGFLASSDEDWTLAVRLLCENWELRDGFGRAGRKLVESYYCLQVAAPKLFALLRSVQPACNGLG